MFNCKVLASSFLENKNVFFHNNSRVAFERILESDSYIGPGLWNYVTKKIIFEYKEGVTGHEFLAKDEGLVAYDQDRKPSLYDGWFGFAIAKGKNSYLIQLFSNTFGHMKDRISAEQLEYFKRLIQGLLGDVKIKFQD